MEVVTRVREIVRAVDLEHTRVLHPSTAFVGRVGRQNRVRAYGEVDAVARFRVADARGVPGVLRTEQQNRLAAGLNRSRVEQAGAHPPWTRRKQRFIRYALRLYTDRL